MVLVGLVLIIVGLAQHRALLRSLKPEPASTHGRSMALHLAAGIGSALVCAALAVYLITSAA